jgi:DNA-binding NarL/FixJ family response regulator
MKHEAMEVLETAIRRVLSGKIYLSEKMSQQVLGKMATSGKEQAGSAVGGLSDRELEVFEMIGRGRSTREIAESLSLSVKTIETYRAKIKEKLSLRNAAELVQHATQWVQRL